MVNNYPKSIKFTTLRIALLVALSSIFSISLAQTVIEIPSGNPNGGTRRSPLGAFFGYERSVMVYDKTEINGGAGIPAGSSISKLEFFYESNDGCPIGLDYNVKVYLREIAPATLGSGTYPSILAGTPVAQLVFNGTMATSNWNSGTGVWISIDLQSCFIFGDNTKSLQVLVETNFGDPPSNDQNGWFSQGSAPCSPQTGNAILFRGSNSTNANFMTWASDGAPPTVSTSPTTSIRPNLRLTYTPAPNCLALSPATPVASMSPVCSGDVFTVTLPGMPCVAGLTYQWQVATGGGASCSTGYGNIPGATFTSLTTSQSAQSWYRCVIGCTFSGTFLNSFCVQVDQNSFLGCYCAHSPTQSADTDIGNVTMVRVSGPTTILNNPPGGCSPTFGNSNSVNTYSDFTGLGPYNMVQGENYTLNLCQITFGSTVPGSFFPAFFNVFIDLNADGVFSTTNERVVTGGPTSANVPTVSGTVNVPFSSKLGVTRMRVTLKENGSAADDPCGVYFGWGETEDYNVNIIAGNVCNLSTPGNAVSSFPSVCTNQLFTLNISGNTTVGSFQTWQWQISTSGAGGPFTNIPGATYIPYITSQTVNSCYRCVLICNAGVPQNTGTVCVPMASPTQCYCIPPHPPACPTSSISNVVFNTLVNPTTCTSGNADSYTQYPVAGSTTTSITQGVTYNLQISTGGSGPGIISVWIDWDRDGLFEPSGAAGPEWFQPSTNNAANTSAPIVPITVPLNSGVGLTGMRVRTRASGSPNGAGDACTQFFSGEAEDYFITLVAATPPNCTQAVVAQVNSTQTAPCSGTNFTLSLNQTLYTGMTYQWQSSTTSPISGFTNIPGATNISYTGNQSTTTYYQVVYNCTLVAGTPVTSSNPNAITVTNTANYWRGVSSDWSDVSNWCAGLPRLVDDVLISRTQPGVASPYNTPIVAVSDTVLAKNITIALNDSITFYNDTLNSVNIAQNLTVNGKFIMRSSVSDTCCTDIYSGTLTNSTYQPFRTNVAENRIQMVYLPNDFVSLPNLSTNDQVTYIVFTLSSVPGSPPATGFQNFKVSYGWLPPTTIQYTSPDPYPTPYTVATIPSLNLAGYVIGQQVVIPVTNFKWRTDSNLVLQFCYDTPTGQLAPGGIPSYLVKYHNTTGRKSTLFAYITNSSLNGGNDGCALNQSTPGVTTNFDSFRPNLRLIFGRSPKKLNIPIGNDLLVNSTGTFLSALANITVTDSLNNQGVFNVDTTVITVNGHLINAGTFDMTYAFGGTNELNSLSVAGQGMINSGTFTAGKHPITVTGTTFDNASGGSFNAGTSFITIGGTNFNNSGTFTPGTSTVMFNNTSTVTPQSIGGTAPLTLYRLRLSKGVNNSLVNLNNIAVTVTDSINLVKGSLDLNGKTLTFTNPNVLTFRPVTATNGYIISAATDFSSKLKWTIGTIGGNHIFPFYKLPLTSPESNGYIPVEFTNAAGVNDNVGDVTAATYPTIANNTPLPPNVWHINNATGVSNSVNMANRYWYLERSNALGVAPNTTLALTVVSAEKELAQSTANMRVQPYYTYTVASPPPLTRAAWLSAPGVQATTTAGLGTPFRTQVTSYNWATAGLASPWASATNAIPLPIELLQFDATLSGTSADPAVDINWATASEEQNDFFTIERTIDFNYITEIDRVASQGNSSMIQKYFTVDQDPVMGKVNYYRLKQTDINGTSSIDDKWVPVKVGVREVFTINYVKNLTSLEVVFEYDNTAKVNVVIRDMAGRTMYSSAGFGATPGLNVLPINTSTWADGAYIITLSDNERQVSHKIFY